MNILLSFGFGIEYVGSHFDHQYTGGEVGGGANDLIQHCRDASDPAAPVVHVLRI